MNDTDIDLLIEDHCRGTLSTADARRLQEWIGDHPNRRRYLAEQVQAHHLLAASQTSVFPTLAAITATIDGKSTAHRRPRAPGDKEAGAASMRYRHWLPWACAAALACALAASLFLHLASDASRPTALVIAGSLPPGSDLGPGSVVAAAEPLRLQLPDGSEIALDTATRVALPDADQTWDLLDGTIRVRANEQPPEAPLRFRTSQAQATVIGTAFSLSHQGGRSELTVRSGRVRFGPHGAAPVIVAAGEHAAVVDGALAWHGSADALRSTGTVLARWDSFDTATGVVPDDRGTFPLTCTNTAAIRPLAAGGFVLTEPTQLVSDRGLGEQIARMQAAGGFTLEAWVLPASLDQTGPGRIFAISKNQWAGNLLLGMGGDHPNDDFCWSYRLRCEQTPGWGRPTRLTKRGLMNEGWVHLVLSVQAHGEEVLYVNGEPEIRQSVGMVFHEWDPDYLLRIGNEADIAKPWLGAIRSIELRAGATTAAAVQRRHALGRQESGR